MMKQQKLSKNNEGFSLVELIIVIAIMAILAGALAPQLIQYLDQSRKGRDVETAQTIATAVNSALSSEKAYNAAASCYLAECTGADSNTEFQKAVKRIIGVSVTNPTPKYHSSEYKDFYIKINPTDKSFEIYAVKTVKGEDAKPDVADMLYPSVGSNFLN
jgi:type IV pilus assembly protein PilA